MRDVLTVFLLLVGSIFTLFAALGLARLPDLYLRLQATAKASTLGMGALVLAVGSHFSDGGVMARSLLILAFVFITGPAAAQAIARAAHRNDVPLTERTMIDELREDRLREESR